MLCLPDSVVTMDSIVGVVRVPRALRIKSRRGKP